jgi:hypothetical protein
MTGLPADKGSVLRTESKPESTVVQGLDPLGDSTTVPMRTAAP